MQNPSGYLYLVSHLQSTLGSPNVQVELFDLDSGELACTKLLEGAGTSPGSAHAGLVGSGQQKSLHLCGGVQDVGGGLAVIHSRCRRANFTTGAFADLPSDGLPVANGASHVSPGDSEWVVIGGTVPDPASPGQEQRTNSIFEDQTGGGNFLEAPFSNVYAPLTWMLGRGCLLRFPGPGGGDGDGERTVTVYLSSDTDQLLGEQTVRGFVDWEGAAGETAPPRSFFAADLSLGPTPVCAHAVDDAGDTHAFFLAANLSSPVRSGEEVSGYSLVVPTSSESAMRDFLDPGVTSVRPVRVPSEGGAAVPSPSGARAASLGDHRLAVVFAAAAAPPLVYDAEERAVRPAPFSLEGVSNAAGRMLMQKVERLDTELCD